MLLNSAGAIEHYGYILFSKQSSRHVPVKATTASAVSILETCSPNSNLVNRMREKEETPTSSRNKTKLALQLSRRIIEPGM